MTEPSQIPIVGGMIAAFSAVFSAGFLLGKYTA